MLLIFLFFSSSINEHSLNTCLALGPVRGLRPGSFPPGSLLWGKHSDRHSSYKVMDAEKAMFIGFQFPRATVINHH